MRINKFLLILLGAATLTACTEKVGEESKDNQLFKENTAVFDQVLSSTEHIQLATEIDTVSYLLGFVNSGSSANLKKMLKNEGCDTTQIDLFLQGITDAIKYNRDKEANAYTQGLQMGLALLKHINNIENHIYGFGQPDHLSPEIVLAGCLDGFNNLSRIKGNGTDPNAMSNLLLGKLCKIDEEYKAATYQEYQKENLDFIEKKAKEEGIQQLSNGVCYKILKAGKGATVQAGQEVEMKYTGKLIDGTTFDSTDEQGETFKVRVGAGRLIPGFDKVLQHMQKGAIWEVYIPAQQAYENNRSGKIPPYSTLIFNIEILQILE